MTLDEAGFFPTILDNPDDDTPRLVNADWLEEHGQTDRAEFIRVQCELVGLQHVTLSKREAELQAKLESPWESTGPIHSLNVSVQCSRTSFGAV